MLHHHQRCRHEPIASPPAASRQKDAARYDINPDIDQLLKGSAAGGLEVNEAHTRANESPRAVSYAQTMQLLLFLQRDTQTHT